jgi:glucosylceramidase
VVIGQKKQTDWGWTGLLKIRNTPYPKYAPVKYARDIIGRLNNWVDGW